MQLWRVKNFRPVLHRVRAEPEVHQVCQTRARNGPRRRLRRCAPPARVRESRKMHRCCRPTRVGCIEKQPRSRQGRVITPMSAPAFFVAAKVHSVAAANARKRTQQVGDKGSSKEGRSSRDPRTTALTRPRRVNAPIVPDQIAALVNAWFCRICCAAIKPTARDGFSPPVRRRVRFRVAAEVTVRAQNSECMSAMVEGDMDCRTAPRTSSVIDGASRTTRPNAFDEAGDPSVIPPIRCLGLDR